MKSFDRALKVKFGWCDPAGIMFFPRYFELANDTLEAWFSGPLGISFRVLHEDMKLSVPTRRFEADFLAPSRLDDWLDIDLRVEKLGNTSCTVLHAVTCDGQARFLGRQTIVLISGATFATVPWPDDLRRKIEPFVESR